MLSTPNDYIIDISKFIKDELSIQVNAVKCIGTIVYKECCHENFPVIEPKTLEYKDA